MIRRAHTREFDKFHHVGEQTFLDNGLAGCVNELGFVILLDEAERVLEVEIEVGSKHVIEIQVDSFLMPFHF